MPGTFDVFGLVENPFRIVPDPRYAYRGGGFAWTRRGLRDAVENRCGTVALIGPGGLGKTTLLDLLAGDLAVAPGRWRVVSVSCDPRTRPEAVLERIPARRAESTRAVLIDEAQHLGPEGVRAVLASLAPKEAGCAVVLAGRPSLDDILDRDEVRRECGPLRRWRLTPLSEPEVADYVGQRLEAAGGRGGLFTSDAITALARHSRGYPRDINALATTALSLAARSRRRVVETALVEQAALLAHGATHPEDATRLGDRPPASRARSRGTWGIPAVALVSGTALAAAGVAALIVLSDARLPARPTPPPGPLIAQRDEAAAAPAPPPGVVEPPPSAGPAAASAEPPTIPEVPPDPPASTSEEPEIALAPPEETPAEPESEETTRQVPERQAAEPPASEPPSSAPPEPEPPAAKEPTVASLLALADRQIRDQALTTPKGANAAETLAAVRERAPGHPEAERLRAAIGTRYVELAAIARRKGQARQAEAFLAKARAFVPDVPRRTERVAAPAPPNPEKSPAPVATAPPVIVATAAPMPDRPRRPLLPRDLVDRHQLERALASGGDPNTRLDGGDTALIRAVRTGRRDLADLLLRRGADPNAANGSGATALMYAAWNGDGRSVRVLLARGARTEMRNVDGRTALMAAAARGHAGVARLLAEGGAEVDARNAFGWTALMYAARAGHREIVRDLLAHGADAGQLAKTER